ncbi:MAG TPA: ComF family protein [Prolixibacteraceae bacterium]|nr:ComF family protein [Prolixibacteraceae bacterium]
MKKIICKLKTCVRDFSTLIYPNVCYCCGAPLVQHEKVLCLKCMVGMPRTHFHLVPGNPVEQLFWGRVPLERATAWFLFQKGSRYQNLLHELKYKGQREIGTELGCYFAADLSRVNYFDETDLLVPVPLHPRKERKRGYNQSLLIASGMASVLGKVLVPDALVRIRYSDTQTRKGRFERWQNVSGLFAVRDPSVFEAKHVLLVDDVITTGSTLEACANKIRECPGAKVSVAALAWASV